LALEEEFAGSEADYSVSASLDSSAVPHEETPQMSSAADGAEHKIEAISAEHNAASLAPVEANVVAETLASAPSEAEPPRPRRNGWWQRARASVIGK
jgi:hypothetical protein